MNPQRVPELCRFPWCHRHHHHRHVSIILGTLTKEGTIIMAEATLSVTPTTASVAVALGTVRDAEGNPSTADPVATGAWSLTDATLGTVSPADGLTTVITLSHTEGTFEVDFAGTTTAGVAVTGKGSITVAAGAPATVDLTLTAQ